MRRSLVIAVLALIIFAIPALPAFAQTPPPAPKVTISGTFDQLTAAGRRHLVEGAGDRHLRRRRRRLRQDRQRRYREDD